MLKQLRMSSLCSNGRKWNDRKSRQAVHRDLVAEEKYLNRPIRFKEGRNIWEKCICHEMTCRDRHDLQQQTQKGRVEVGSWRLFKINILLFEFFSLSFLFLYIHVDNQRRMNMRSYKISHRARSDDGRVYCNRKEFQQNDGQSSSDSVVFVSPW